VGKPSATSGQPTRPTQPFILSGSIKRVVSWNQMCAAVYRLRHLVRATKVNAGLAESNGRLLAGLWRDSLHVTCGLTVCTPGSAPGPTLVNEYGKTLPFQWVGMDWVSQLRGRVRSGHTKWTHGQLCTIQPHHTTFRNVVWFRCGVPGLWSKVGTCGPPYLNTGTQHELKSTDL